MASVDSPADTLNFPQQYQAILNPYLPLKNNEATLKDQPFVTLTFATSLDSQISAAPGTQTILSGSHSKAMTHYLRSKHDAILVGVGTAEADDPGLNCRLQGVGGYGGLGLEGQPQPIIIDPKARWNFSERSKLFRLIRSKKGKAPLILTTSSDLPTKRRNLLEELGGRYVHMESQQHLSMKWNEILRMLRLEGIRSLMIEGGGHVINTLLNDEHQNYINSIILTIAPTWLGNGGVAISPLLKEQLHLKDVRWLPLGEDVVMAARPIERPGQ